MGGVVEQSTKGTATSWALFAVTYLSYSALYFARKPVSVVKSTLVKEAGLSLSALGLIDSSMLAMYALGQFMVGSTVKLGGRRAPIVLAFALSGALTAAFGLCSSAAPMALAWGANGLFAACVNPLLVLFVADLFPASARASVISLWSTSQQFGGIGANALASYLLATRGWRDVFFASGALVAAFAPIYFAVFRLLPPEEKPAAPASPRPPSPEMPVPGASSLVWTQERRMEAAAADALRDLPSDSEDEDEIKPKTPARAEAYPAVEAPPAAAPPPSGGVFSLAGAPSLGVAYTLVKMSRYCLMFWLPYFLSTHAGLAPSTAGVLSAVFDVAGVAGSISAGVLCDRLMGGRMLAASVPYLLCAAVTFAAWAALCRHDAQNGGTDGGAPPSFAAHALAIGLAGFFIAAPDGIYGGAAPRNLCDYAKRGGDGALAAAAAGFVNGCGSVGAIGQGFVTYKVVEVCGWEGLFASLAAAMAATAVAVRPALAVEEAAMGGAKASKRVKVA